MNNQTDYTEKVIEMLSEEKITLEFLQTSIQSFKDKIGTDAKHIIIHPKSYAELLRIDEVQQQLIHSIGSRVTKLYGLDIVQTTSAKKGEIIIT
jgi:hypothetical protein